MPLGTCVISFSYRQYERLHFIYGRFRFYQCCLRDLLRRQPASTRLRSGRPSSSPAGDARLCRIFRAESLRSDCIARPRSELLGPSKYRSILPSNHCKIPSYLASRSLNKCRAIGIDPILSYHPSIQVDERVFVSGQIGLVPSSMSIPAPRSLATEIPLASQHADRIVKALSSGAGGGWDGHAQLLLYWVAQERHISHAIAAAQRLDVSAQSLFQKEARYQKYLVFFKFLFLGGPMGD
jgi:enamine deaminase RidA (YjgF/YER057c/UK114 family)